MIKIFSKLSAIAFSIPNIAFQALIPKLETREEISKLYDGKVLQSNVPKRINAVDAPQERQKNMRNKASVRGYVRINKQNRLCKHVESNMIQSKIERCRKW